MYDHTIRNISLNLPLAHILGADTTLVYSILQVFNDDAQSEGIELADNFFSATFEDLSIFTALGKNKINKAIQSLEELSLIETSIRGMPRRLHIKLNNDDTAFETLNNIMEEGEKKISEAIENRKSKIQEYYM